MYELFVRRELYCGTKQKIIIIREKIIELIINQLLWNP